MARTIGAVEVTVDANTRKLRVTMVRDAEKTGKDAKKVLEAELAKVEAELFLNSAKARAELEKFQTAADRSRVDLRLGLDTDEAEAAWFELEEKIERDEAQLNLGLDPESSSKLRANIKELEEQQRQIEFGIEMEPQATAILEAQLERIETEHRTIQMEAVLDEAQALAELRLLEEKKVEIGFTSDLTEATAEYETWATRLGNARISPVIDGDFTDFELALKELKAQVAFEKFQIELEMDSRQLEADLARLQAEAEAVARKQRIIDFQMKLDTRQFELDAEAAVRLAERQEVDIDFTGDFTKVTKDLTRFTQQVKFKRLDISIGADIAEAVADTRFLAEFISGQSAEIPVDADLKAARAAIEVFRILQQNNDIEIPVHLDLDAMDAALTRAEAQAAVSGGESGSSFGKAFSSGFGGSFDQTKVIIAAVVSMGQPLAAALSGTVAAATSVVSSGISAIGAAAGAATPIVAGFAGALAAVVVGSQGFGTAISAINKEFEEATAAGREMSMGDEDILKSLKNLAPEARDTAEAFFAMRGELGRMRLDVQNQLFAGFGDVLRDLGKTVLPDISASLVQLAGRVNIFGHQLAGVAKETDFSGIAEGLAPALDDAFDAATAVAGTIGPFLKAASPAAEKLAEMIERGAEGLEAWVKANPDKIAEFLDDGLKSLQEWVDLIKDVGDLLGTVFKAGKDQGDNFVESLDKMISRWDTFLEGTEGQNKLETFFDTGREAMDALKPVLAGLKEGFKTLAGGGALDNFKQLAQSIGDALPGLAEILSFTGKLQLADAFATIVGAMEPFFDLINDIPEPLLEFIGMLTVVSFGVFKAASAAVGFAKSLATLEKALVKIGASTPQLIALTIAFTALVAIYSAVTGKNEEAQRKFNDLTSAIDASTASLIRNHDAANENAVGIEAINRGLLDVGDNEKTAAAAFKTLNEGTGDLNLQLKDLTPLLIDMAKDPVKSLTSLAEGFGLPTKAAEGLAKIVNETDNNFDDIDRGFFNIKGPSKLQTDLEGLSEATGISKGELAKAGKEMERVQDIVEDSNIERYAKDQLALAAVTDSTTQAQLLQAQAMADQQGVGDDVIAVYQNLIQIQYDTKKAADEATAALKASGYRDVQHEAADAAAAIEEHNRQLVETGQKAHVAWIEQQALANKTRDVAVEQAAAMGVSRDLAEQFVTLGDEARIAANKADALRSILDTFVAPAANVQQSFSDLEAQIDEFDELVTGGTEAQSKREEAMDKMVAANKAFADAAKEAGEGDAEAAKNARERGVELRGEGQELLNQVKALEASAKSLDLNTEAGRTNAQHMRDMASDALTLAGNMLQIGSSSEEVTAQMAKQRDELVRQAQGFGLPLEKAKEYVDTLLGTPEFLNTIVSTPGILDALIHAKDLSLLYDAAGNPVITEFEALGLDEQQAHSEEFKATLEKLGLIHVKPTIDTTAVEGATTAVEGAQTAADTLDATTATPTVDVASMTADQKLADLQTQLATLNATVVHPVVEIPNLDNTLRKVKELDTLLRNLPGVVRIPTPPSPVPPGGMAGALIGREQFMRVGERGYREALIPLDLPLNRVDRSVRDMAAYLRGADGKMQFPPTKVVNNYMTITPAAADPVAVATSVINRAAAMAANL